MQGDKPWLVAQQGAWTACDIVQLQALWFTGDKKEAGGGDREERKKQEKVKKENCQAPPPNKQTKNQKTQKTKNKKTLLHLQLAWPDSQIENLGQNTGDLPPRTIADYSILHFKKERGGGPSRKCKWGLSCSTAQQATISEQWGLCSLCGDAAWQDKFTAVRITVEHEGPGGSHLGLTAHKLYHRYSCG